MRAPSGCRIIPDFALEMKACFTWNRVLATDIRVRQTIRFHVERATRCKPAPPALLSNAKARKDLTEQFVGGKFADNHRECLLCPPQLLRE